MSLNEHRPASWNSRVYAARFVIVAAAIVFAGLAITGTLGMAQAITGFAILSAAAWLGSAGVAEQGRYTAPAITPAACCQ